MGVHVRLRPSSGVPTARASLLLLAAVIVGCGSSPDSASTGATTVVVHETLSEGDETVATNAVEESTSLPTSVVADTSTGSPTGGVPPAPPEPDLGTFDDQTSLIDALNASGSLDNQLNHAGGGTPSHSICADIVQSHEPTVGTLIHEAIATLNGQTGVVLVFEQTYGTREVRMYGTGDPVTGGCPLIFQAAL